MDSALTPTDVMLMTKHRGNATATTGVALASGLGGGALLLAIAGLWGMNQIWNYMRFYRTNYIYIYK